MVGRYIQVARPKQLKFYGNKLMKLYNFTPEDVARITTIMKPSESRFDFKEAAEEAAKPFPNKAIGTRLNPISNEYEVVVLEVDFDNKKSKVVEIIPVGKLRGEMSDKFKMLALKYNLL